MLRCFPVTYLPRPDSERTAQDVDEIYILAAEALQRAQTPEERRNAFRQALQRAYEAGTDAQREIVQAYSHDRPTPVPPPPSSSPPAAEEDPGLLPPGPRPHATPAGAWKPPKPPKR